MNRGMAHPAWHDRLRLAIEAAVFVFGLTLIVAVLSLEAVG